MDSEILYELRVLNGEQRGASTTMRPGQDLHIGQDWSNDIVLQDATDAMAQLTLDDDGTPWLTADAGACQIAGAAAAYGDRLPLTPYAPFFIGNVRLAVGRMGAAEWTAVFDEREPAAQPDGAAESAAPEADGAQRPAAHTDWWGAAWLRVGWLRRVLIGGLALVGISAGTLTLALATGPTVLPASVQVEQIRRTLASNDFAQLKVRHEDDRMVVSGHIASDAERARLDQVLSGRKAVRVNVWVDEQIAASVADVFRLNGIRSEVSVQGPGAIHVQTHEGDLDKLQKTQALAERDVSGLRALTTSNKAPPPVPPLEPVVNDPGKRVAAIVPGKPAYVVTADGTRYFQGATLPTGHRIVAIAADHIKVSRNGEEGALQF